MPVISLPDGSQRQFDQPVSVLAIAQDIGPGLARATRFLSREMGMTLLEVGTPYLHRQHLARELALLPSTT